jgi:hypothetical protein
VLSQAGFVLGQISLPVSAAGGISRGFSASCFVLADFCCGRLFVSTESPEQERAGARPTKISSPLVRSAGGSLSALASIPQLARLAALFRRRGIRFSSPLRSSFLQPQFSLSRFRARAKSALVLADLSSLSRELISFTVLAAGSYHFLSQLPARALPLAFDLYSCSYV